MFKQASLVHHPDKVGPDMKQQAKETFQELKKSKDILLAYFHTEDSVA